MAYGKVETIADGFFVQVVITQPQASLLAWGLDNIMVPPDVEAGQIAEGITQLRDFFTVVADSPRSFPVTGRYARSIKARKRMFKKVARVSA